MFTRAKAFTIIELIVVMLLSSVLVLVCFQVYLNAANMHAAFKRKIDFAEQAFLAYQDLERLFYDAQAIRVINEDQIHFTFRNNKVIVMSLEDGYILRTVEQKKVDTLRINANISKLEQLEHIHQSKLVKGIYIKIEGKEYFFHKAYDALTLLKGEY